LLGVSSQASHYHKLKVHFCRCVFHNFENFQTG
jgi:hypothetical protein